MKTIVLIGKTNDTTRELLDFLRGFFRVRSCTEETRQALGMLKVAEPDLIVISLVDFTKAEKALLEEIQSEFSHTPVLTVGTVDERLTFGAFYPGGQFENLSRPVVNEKLFSAVCRRLGQDEQSVKDEAAALRDDNRKNVLVVDDNAAMLRAIKMMLDIKYQVTLANSGMKALTSMGKKRPDVVLLDYEMPICDGKQTLEMIRADGEFADIPVIFLTSVNDKEHIEAVVKLRPAGYLLKPAVPGKLIEAIEKALGAL